MYGRNSSANNLFRFSASLLALEDEDGHRHNDSLESNSGKLPVAKSYDYTLKFLLVGDSDVGKEEILNGLNQDEDHNNDDTKEASFCGSPGVNYKSTIILLDGKRIRLQLWYV